MMDFTTPPSYGTTVVNVGGIATDGALLFAGATNTATHSTKAEDPDTKWPEPKTVVYSWTGTTADGKPVSATLEGPLGERRDRVDVMVEVPEFVKTIVAAAAGTRPYIYQYTPKFTLKLKIGEEEIVEEGSMFTEATFISSTEAPVPSAS